MYRGTIRNENGKKNKRIKDLPLDYLRSSTLHGLQYVAEKRLTSVEKLFWIVTFTVSLILCSFLIKNVYIKWKTSPVIVTVSERLVSVGEIPFPSVTICPQIKSISDRYNFSMEFDKTMANETVQDYDKFLDISLICKLSEFHIGERLYTNEKVTEHIDSVAPKLDDFMMFCSWRNNTINVCEKLFRKVYTAEGVCYNMNGLAAEEVFRDSVRSNYKYSERDEFIKGWSIENGYTGLEENSFPMQGNENGATPDLEVYFINNLNNSDGLCNGLNSGFKIYIQHPTDHAQSSLYSYSVLDGQESSMAISADVLTTAPSLKDYPPEIRQCYFHDDRMLRYFKIYTSSNCRAECLSNYTLKTCGCVGFHMPHGNSSRICAENNLECMEIAQNVLAKRELHDKIRNTGKGCNCLPACNNIEYNAEVLTSQFLFKRYIRKLDKLYKRDYNLTYDTDEYFK